MLYSKKLIGFYHVKPKSSKKYKCYDLKRTMKMLIDERKDWNTKTIKNNIRALFDIMDPSTKNYKRTYYDKGDVPTTEEDFFESYGTECHKNK
jgi:hypothetical protein